MLKALENASYERGINAKAVAHTLWGNDPSFEYLFTGCSKQGNGACRGMKAWLCAGSLIGKLRKQRLVEYDRFFTGYYLTSSGRSEIMEYESNINH